MISFESLCTYIKVFHIFHALGVLKISFGISVCTLEHKCAVLGNFSAIQVLRNFIKFMSIDLVSLSDIKVSQSPFSD
jgi:hypothetical protein